MICHATPLGYETKFYKLIQLCDAVSRRQCNERTLVIGHPWVLGDTYEEVMESLKRIADAGLLLGIAAGDQADPSQN